MLISCDKENVHQLMQCKEDMTKQSYLIRIVFLIILTFSLPILSSCNVRGFFISQNDDPAWEDEKPKEVAGGSVVPGAQKYNQNCAACHQATGKGMAGSIPGLAGSAMAMNPDASAPIRIVLNGFKGEIVRNGTKYNGVMQAWKDTFSDEEIADILTYVRSNWGNKAEKITAEQVKAVREKVANRSTAWTESELAQPL